MAQLAGYVSEHSAYHHGEASLQATIVNLAQDFVSSNNINLLFPSGQFGTRLQGGKDSASARYIFTRLALLTRHLFNEDDDALLDYQVEEGQKIEPTWSASPLCLFPSSTHRSVRSPLSRTLRDMTTPRPARRATMFPVQVHASAAAGARQRRGGHRHWLVDEHSELQPRRDCQQPAAAPSRRGAGADGTVVPRLHWRHC